MYYVATISEVIQVEPRYIGPDFKRLVRLKLNDMMEGNRDRPKLLGDLGYLIKIPNISDDHISSGVIAYESGYVDVHVKYKAIMCRLFKNEKIGVKVFFISYSHIVASVGPFDEIIITGIDDAEWEWDEENRLFRNVDDENVVIEQGCKCRVKITSVNIKSHTVSVQAAIAEDFQGPYE